MKKTYKEALLPTPVSKNGLVGRSEERFARKTLDESKTEDLLQPTMAETGESHPVLRISKGTLQNISTRWERALIVRIFEEVRNIQAFEKRLQNLWKIGFQIQIKDIGRGYFIVHGLSEDERTTIITGRPWRLGVNPITVRSWVPNFSAKNETNSFITAIWVIINYLPIEYQSPEILIALGNKIVKTIALDGRNSTTASRVRL